MKRIKVKENVLIEITDDKHIFQNRVIEVLFTDDIHNIMYSGLVEDMFQKTIMYLSNTIYFDRYLPIKRKNATKRFELFLKENNNPIYIIVFRFRKYRIINTLKPDFN